jgi:hypothetical protein
LIAHVLVWDSTESLGGTIGTDRDVLFSRSTDAGATWTAPAALDFATASTGTGDELNPDPATDLTGAWTVVWETNENLGGLVGTDWDLVVSRSVDDGVTWSIGTPLNVDAATDLGGNYYPRIATQVGGTSVVTWHSDENANNAVATDWDVFFASGLESDTVAACIAPGAFAASTVSLGAGEHHYCENWSFLMQAGANLSDSFLVRIDLSNAVLSGSVLAGADLSGADLSNASLFNAGLQSTILASADLTGADLSFADLSGALYDENTVFPPGGTYDSGAWGLPGGVSPWAAGMIPVPEPSFGWMLGLGAAALLFLSAGRTRERAVIGPRPWTIE